MLLFEAQQAKLELLNCMDDVSAKASFSISDYNLEICVRAVRYVTPLHQLFPFSENQHMLCAGQPPRNVCTKMALKCTLLWKNKIG